MAAYHEDIVECLLLLTGTLRSMEIRNAKGDFNKPGQPNETVKVYVKDITTVLDKLKTMKMEQVMDSSPYRKITLDAPTT